MSDPTAPQGGDQEPDRAPWSQPYPGPPDYDPGGRQLGAMPGGEYVPLEKPPVPQSLLLAVKVMYAGAAVSLISLVVTLFSHGAIHDAVVQQNAKQTGTRHLTASQVGAAVNVAFGIGIVLGIIGIGLWLWMARTNQAGRWWARIVATVLCVLNVLSTISALTRSGSTTFTTILAIVLVIIGIVATVLLYRPDSSDYFSGCRAMRNTP